MDKKPYPSELQDRFIVRMPDGMRDRIKAAAEASGRSMNAEIVQALQAYYDIVERDPSAISRALSPAIGLGLDLGAVGQEIHPTPARIGGLGLLSIGDTIGERRLKEIIEETAEAAAEKAHRLALAEALLNHKPKK